MKFWGLALFLACLVNAATAATIVVGPTGDYEDLSSAWDAANAWDVLSIQTGTYMLATDPGMMNLMPSLDDQGHGKPVTIQSQTGNAADVVIDGACEGGYPYTIFIWMTIYGGDHHCSLTVKNLTLLRMDSAFSFMGDNINLENVHFDKTQEEAVIWNCTQAAGSVLIENCHVWNDDVDNLGLMGGAIAISTFGVDEEYQTVDVIGCSWRQCVYGLYISGTTMGQSELMSVGALDCAFDRCNTAISVLGWNGPDPASVYVTNCVVDSCGVRGIAEASPVEVGSSEVMMEGCTVSNTFLNCAIKVWRSQGYEEPHLYLNHSMVNNCYGSMFGTVYVDRGSLDMIGTTIKHCGRQEGYASGDYLMGGGIWCWSTYQPQHARVSLDYCTIEDCIASTGGGAILSANVLIVTHCNFIGNWADGIAVPSPYYNYGGGLWLQKLTTAFEYNVIAHNMVSNSVHPDNALGAGVAQSGSSGSTSFGMQRNTITWNYSKGYGGGIYVGSYAPMDALKCIVRDNCSDHESGSDIYATTGGHLSCCDLTPANIYVKEGMFVQTNCINVDPMFCWAAPQNVACEDGARTLCTDLNLKKATPCWSPACGLIGARPKAASCAVCAE